MILGVDYLENFGDTYIGVNVNYLLGSAFVEYQNPDGSTQSEEFELSTSDNLRRDVLVIARRIAGDDYDFQFFRRSFDSFLQVVSEASNVRVAEHHMYEHELSEA